MNRLMRCIVVATSCAAAIPAAGIAAAQPVDVVRVAVIGDSLTRGYGVRPEESWASILESRVPGDNVLPLGFDGATARTWNTVHRGHLDQLAAWRPATVLVALGGNDYHRSVPTDRYQANLRRLVDDVRAVSPPGTRVVLWHYHRIRAVPVHNLCDVDQCGPAVPSPTWRQYGDAMRAVAVGKVTGYVDNSVERDWLGEFPLPGENPRVHLSWQGHRVMEQSVRGRLLACC